MGHGYGLHLQQDGDIILREWSATPRTSRVIWQSHTAGSAPDNIVLQPDGNLCAYSIRRNPTGEAICFWSSNTWASGLYSRQDWMKFRFGVAYGGNMEIWGSPRRGMGDDKLLWESKTHQLADQERKERQREAQRRQEEKAEQKRQDEEKKLDEYRRQEWLAHAPSRDRDREDATRAGRPIKDVWNPYADRPWDPRYRQYQEQHDETARERYLQEGARRDWERYQREGSPG